MTIGNKELLQKATFDTSAFGGGSGGVPGTGAESPLAIDVVNEFIELMTAGQVMLSDVRSVSHRAPKWQESIIDFAGRIMKPGTQGTRLADGDRSTPTTGLIEMNTVLARAEVPVTDEVFEDNVAGDGIGNSLERLIADRAGYDLEELFVQGDTGSGDAFLALNDGWLKIASTRSGGNVLNAASIGQDYQEVFKRLLIQMPDRYKRNLEVDGRFYVPKRLEEKYRDILSSRGTAMGDLMLTGRGELRYQGILIKGIHTFPITAATPDTSYVLLTNRNNLYAGFQRNLKFESFRDPREGQTSFIVTMRVDCEVAVLGATSVATNVDVEP